MTTCSVDSNWRRATALEAIVSEQERETALSCADQIRSDQVGLESSCREIKVVDQGCWDAAGRLSSRQYEVTASPNLRASSLQRCTVQTIKLAEIRNIIDRTASHARRHVSPARSLRKKASPLRHCALTDSPPHRHSLAVGGTLPLRHAMRLFLLPISSRRSLIYCEKLHEKAASDRSLLDRVTIKANETWVAWEKDEKAVFNWKKKVTFYGNHALKRIPYEEWGLKTIPALTTKRKAAIVDGKEKYQVMFPGLYLKQEKVPEILQKLAEERQAMHRSKMIWSIVAMPFSAPFMLIPVYVFGVSTF